MLEIKNRLQKFKMVYLQAAWVILLIFLAALLLWHGKANSSQSTGAGAPNIYFEGEYRIGDGEWHTIESGKHISASQGDVTLKGNFHVILPDGTYRGIYSGSDPIAFYTDHINLAFREGGKAYKIGHENPILGASACGQSWALLPLTPGNTDPIEIVVHNPHHFGNENAIDEMLSNFAVCGRNIDFEKGVMRTGETQRNAGLMLILVSVVFLGIALFASLIHIKKGKIIWLIGLVILFAGIYFVFTAWGVSFWSESIVFNTTILVASVIFYMLFFSMTIAHLLRKTKKIGNAVVFVLSVIDAIFFVLPMITSVLFYDILIPWIIVQIVANVLLAVCLIKEIVKADKKAFWFYGCLMLPLIAFVLDVVGVKLGVWNVFVLSQYVFIVLLISATFMVLRLIPSNINAVAKAKELAIEKVSLNAQLTEARVSTMMSQIRPHFIYNTLGSIEQLCRLDPPMAENLVHNFAKYLRGNFGELDNTNPILLSQEMEHVKYYVSIEKVRFPDMTFAFEINSEDFKIPALTIQPIVENSIKHGLMKLSQGGTIKVTTYDTSTDHCVLIEDNGVGFDTNELFKDRKHLGLRNIRERLKIMVNGTLEIESNASLGTKVLIKIPKEV